jgi:hypothetical protein
MTTEITTQFPTIKSQLKLVTGKQIVCCQDCGNQMTVTVGGIKKEAHRSFRPYRGTCRKCGTMYSAVLNTRQW